MNTKVIPMAAARKPAERMHVDCFIDHGLSREPDANEIHARWVLFGKRLPATLQMAFQDKFKNEKLYCDYMGITHRITMASRMGHIGLNRTLDVEYGYDVAVWIEDVTNLRPAP